MTDPAPVSSRRTRARLLVSVALLVVAASTLALYQIAQGLQTVTIPTGTPTGELIFASDAGGDWDIYSISPAGAVRALTADSSGGHDYFASWDFASARINFITTRTGSSGPGQVEPDGSNLRTLDIVSGIMVLFSEGRLDWDPQWSPDGTRLVWASLRDLNLELYVSDASDSETRLRLTSHAARDWFPAWSPDGTLIAFSSDREGEENIYTIRADGTDLRQWTEDPATDSRPLFALDGRSLLFVSERVRPFSSGQLDFYRIDLESGETSAFEGVFEGGAVWSPDGAQMAYISNIEGQWAVYVRDASDTDGTTARRITGLDAASMFPAWRPGTN